MLLAKVIGTVVSTRKEQSMAGLKFLLLRPLDAEGKETGAPVVAVDAVGAGPHEIVLFATGSSARQMDDGHAKPRRHLGRGRGDPLFDLSGRANGRRYGQSTSPA